MSNNLEESIIFLVIVKLAPVESEREEWVEVSGMISNKQYIINYISIKMAVKHVRTCKFDIERVSMTHSVCNITIFYRT